MTWERYKSNITSFETETLIGKVFNIRSYCDDTSGTTYITKGPVCKLIVTPSIQFTETNLAWDISNSVSATGTVDTYSINFGGPTDTGNISAASFAGAKTGNIQYTAPGTYTIVSSVVDTLAAKSKECKQEIRILQPNTYIATQRVYISTIDGGVFILQPGQIPFTSNSGLTGNHINIRAMRMHPNFKRLPASQQHLWCATQDGVALSTNGATTWTVVSEATLGTPTNTAGDAVAPTATDPDNIDIAFDPTDQRRVYLLRTTATRTWLYLTDDYGSTWSNTQIELPIGVNTAVDFDTTANKKNNIHVISMGDGTNQAFIIWNTDNEKELYGTVIDISGITLTAGTSKLIDTQSNAGADGPDKGFEVARITDTTLVAAYSDFDDHSVFSLVLTITAGPTFTLGTDLEIEGTFESRSVTVDTLSATKAIYAWVSVGESNIIKGVVCTITGTALSAGATKTIDAGSNDSTQVVALSGTQAMLLYTDISNSNRPTARILDVSGTTITVGTDVVCDTDAATLETATNEVRGRKRLIKISSTRAVAIWVDNGDKKIKGCILDVSGSTITPRTSVDLTSATNSLDRSPSLAFKSSTELLLAYDDSSTNGRVVPLTISDNTLSADTGDDTVFNSSTPNWESIAMITSSNFLLAWNDESGVDGKMAMVSGGFAITHSAGGIPGSII